MANLWRSMNVLRPVKANYDIASRRSVCYFLLIHGIPVAAAATTIGLNLAGYWVGKELSGSHNQNIPKLFALQMTARGHELLMVLSLSDIMMTCLLESFTKDSLPVGPFAKLKRLSCLWSQNYVGTFEPSIRLLFAPFLILLAIVGIVIGPSSSATMIPRLAEWPAGDAVMTVSNGASPFPSELKRNLANSSALRLGTRLKPISSHT